MDAGDAETINPMTTKTTGTGIDTEAMTTTTTTERGTEDTPTERATPLVAQLLLPPPDPLVFPLEETRVLLLRAHPVIPVPVHARDQTLKT